MQSNISVKRGSQTIAGGLKTPMKYLSKYIDGWAGGEGDVACYF